MRIFFSILGLMFCLIHSQALASEGQTEALPFYALSSEHIITLSNGLPVSDISKAGSGRTNVFGAVDIETNTETIWAVMRDCGAQLDIIPKLKSCEILEENTLENWDRRQQIVKLGFPLPNVRSEFRSDYTPFKHIGITGTGGDLSYLKGEWILTPLSAQKTRVTYRAQMKSRLPVPAGFIRKAVRKDMPVILSNLKTVAEAKDP